MGLPVGYGAKQLVGGQTSALKTPAALSPVGALHACNKSVRRDRESGRPPDCVRAPAPR